MRCDLRASASLVAGAVDVVWRITVPGTVRAPLRLVRRAGGYPAQAEDGDVVFELDELYRDPPAATTPWGRIDRWRCLTRNGPANHRELVQAFIDQFFVNAADAQPLRVVLGAFDQATNAMVRRQIDEVSRVVRTAVPAAPPFARAIELQIFTKPGGGAEVSAGVILISDFVGAVPPADESAAGLFTWTPAVGPVSQVSFHVLRVRSQTSAVGDDFDTSDTTDLGAAFAIQRATVRSARDDAADATEWTIAITELGLAPGRVGYYRAFTSPAFPIDGVSTARAMPTGDFGMAARMYGTLPPVHRITDLETPMIGGRGQLARFISPLGAALDHVRGQVVSLSDRQDIDTARLDLIPHLSRMIGWEPDLTASGTTQRSDLAVAAELFAGVGTHRNTPALVRRVTGWPAEVKEFANNVLLTNAPEAISLREIWHVSEMAGVWSVPAPVTLTTRIDGDPVTVEVGGVPWVIWQSDRSERRELWLQRIGVDASPLRVMAGAVDDVTGATFFDEAPAVLARGAGADLFWASDRSGTSAIWTRSLAPAPGPATRLTNRGGQDRFPAVVVAGATTWLFWDSDRRGVWDIWFRQLVGGVWGAETRLVKDDPFDLVADTRPAAIVAPNGDLWLFWCRDMGDRREIWQRAFTGGTWGPSQSLSVNLGGGGRDEAPCPIVRAGRVLLFFHSNRGGPWQIWSRVHDGATWQAITRLSAETTADVEATGFVAAGGSLEMFWSSARRTPWYCSRTLDLSDAHMLNEMRTFDDHTHYMYDTGVGDDDWYARGAIGVYPTPDTADPAKIADGITRSAQFVEPFRPAPVRFVWPLADVARREPIAAGRPGASWAGGT